MGRLARVEKRDARRVGGRYRLDEKLGTGGMSVVWRGYDEILGRAVAVKVLSARLADDRTFRERLRQEALSAARLCHPHITGIFDYGESPVTVDGVPGDVAVPYVVMELNDGESVSSRLTRRGPIPWREAVSVAAEVASALATAHARGVVHRDVTPANVMLTSAGAKVVDFGISALIGELDLAPDGSLLGTPAYLAPERLSGGHVSPATDVYALGLLLYRALTGRLPWRAQNTTEALRAHLYADPEPIPSQPGLPPAVAELCLSCLHKAPSDRPDAATVAHTLAAVVGRAAVIPPLRSLQAAATPLPDRLGQTLAVLRSGWWRRARWVGHRRVHAAAATVTLLAVVGVAWTSSQDTGEVGPAQAAAAGAGAAVAVEHPIRCRARYQVRRDSGSAFDVSLAITVLGQHPVGAWSLEFSFPGNQRLLSLSGPVGEFEQVGKNVTVRAAAGAALQPGRAREMFLHGAYEQVNPLPFEFAVNGRQCRVMVLGTAVVQPRVPSTGADEGEAGARRAGGESSGTAAGAPRAPAKTAKRTSAVAKTARSSPTKKIDKADRARGTERAAPAEKPAQRATPPSPADGRSVQERLGGMRQLRPVKPGRFGVTAV